MKKINFSKGLNIASVAFFAISMTVLGLFLAPKAASAMGTNPWTGCFPDFNNDGNVNLSDLSFFGTHYPSVENGAGNYDVLADVNGDGKVNSFDQAIFEIYFNKPFAGCASVPNFPTLCPDYDGNGEVNLSDFSYFSTYQKSNTSLADFDQDNDSDDFDAAIFGVYYNTNYVCPVGEIKGLGTPVPPAGCFPNFLESNQPNFVDLSDFAAFGTHYDSVEGDGKYVSLYDANGDGKIDETDKDIFALYYNKPFTCGQTRIINFASLCPDFNEDHKVNLSDLAYFGQYLTEQNLWADFDGDSNVDEDDKAIFELYYNTDFTCSDYSFLHSDDKEENGTQETPVSQSEPKSEIKTDPAVVSQPVATQPANATTEPEAIATLVAVGGAENTGVVAGAEDESLPKAGIDITSYLIILAGLSGLAFILKK